MFNQPAGTGICDDCKRLIPVYDSVMARHGIFECGPGEEMIICPGSETSNFDPVLREEKLLGEQNGDGAGNL
jgi:hypothetical protein